LTLPDTDARATISTLPALEQPIHVPKRLQFYPRIRVDYREFDKSGDSQWTIAPSMRLDYRPTLNMFRIRKGDTTKRNAIRKISCSG